MSAQARRWAYIDPDALRVARKAQVEGATMFTRRHVINLADFFGCSPRQIVRECERLGLAKRGTWDWFLKNGGITRDHIEQVRADRAAATVQRAAAGGDK